MRFDFINDDRFKTVLERDYEELRKCFDSGHFKSTLILSGSLIETLIAEFFCNKLPDGYSENKILTLSLDQLLGLAIEEKLIDQTTKDLSSVVKSYRNLIHPGREIRKGERFDKNTASVAFNLVEMIISHIQDNYSKIYGYSAKDVMNKISNDRLSIGIFEVLVEKLNQSEKIKLLNQLTDQEISEQKPEYEVDEPKEFISKLKKYLPEEEIRKKVEFLHNKVETGNQREVVALYNLYHENLGLIEVSKKETIVRYMLSILSDITEISPLYYYSGRKIFVTLYKYISSNALEELFKTTMRDYYQYQSKFSILESIYNQIMNGFKKEQKDALEQYFEENPSSMSRFWEDDSIPF